MLNITIKTIQHAEQRYETPGNYGENQDHSVWFEISDLGNETQEMAIALHELLERHLCKLHGVNLAKIDEWDIAYEKIRKERGVLPCGCPIQEEPGDDMHAPYHNEHFLATLFEKEFMHICGEDWEEYDKKVNALSQE